MKFIIVKNFTDVNSNYYDYPKLNLEDKGKSHSIVNFRNLHFCDISNTICGL